MAIRVADRTAERVAPAAAGMTAEVDFRHVDIVFGPDPKPALELLDQGAGRDAILEQTGHVIGVADANVTIEAGEICVLMGLSGSGKSTLLRCVNGLNKATRGEVLVDDPGGPVDVTSCDAATLRRLRTQRIAMVFQQFALLPWRTVAENVGFGLELRGMAKPERDKVVAEKLKLVNLDQWKDKHAHELSGGMQQRVGLARAFATDADILLDGRAVLRARPADPQPPAGRAARAPAFPEEDHHLRQPRPRRGDEARHPHRDHGERPDRAVRPAGGYRPQPIKQLRRRLRRAHEPVERAARGLADDAGRRGRTPRRADPARPRPPGGDDPRPDGRAHGGDRRRPPRPPGRLPADGFDLARLERDVVVTAPPDIKLKSALEIRHKTGNPLALIEDGKLIGLIGDDEIYRGILRQTEIAG